MSEEWKFLCQVMLTKDEWLQLHVLAGDMSIGEYAAKVLREHAQQGVQPTGGTYPLKIDDGAELVVVRQYDSAGDEISISNILPPSTTRR